MLVEAYPITILKSPSLLTIVKKSTSDKADLPLMNVLIKLESNFLMDYDEDGYPSDVFVSMEDLFHTQSQVDKFIKTMEGATYRLKQ